MRSDVDSGQTSEVTDLRGLLDQIEKAARANEEVTLKDILDRVGRRSFGPLLLVAGLITVIPLVGDIPGVSALMGTFVAVLSAQLFMDRSHFWLPEWLLSKSIDGDKLCNGIDKIGAPVAYIDKVIKRRLTVLTEGTGTKVVGTVCLLIGATMPALEFVPFSATFAGTALVGFGLSLIAHDGVLAMLAYAFTAGTVSVLIAALI